MKIFFYLLCNAQEIPQEIALVQAKSPVQAGAFIQGVAVAAGNHECSAVELKDFNPESYPVRIFIVQSGK